MTNKSQLRPVDNLRFMAQVNDQFIEGGDAANAVGV